MVREHRSGPRVHLRFAEPDEPEEAEVPDEPAGAPESSPWGERFAAALAAAGVVLPRTPAEQVEDLAVAPGVITATVTGADGEAQRVRVGLRPLDDDTWDAAVAALAGDSWASAALARGQVPDALDAALADVGADLLPRVASSLPLDCTCPDWAMPCAHVAAALVSVAERFAGDPFALVRWRGRERRALRDAVRDRRVDPPGADAALLARWYRAGGPVPRTSGAVTAPTRADALLDELPPLGPDADPTDDDGRRLDAREVLRPLYRRLGAEGGRSG